MNIFGELILIEDFSFEKVKFYTIQFDHRENSEFTDFLMRMENETEYEDDMNHLFIWLEKIGNEEGAKPKYFRHEGYLSDTSALPPSRRIMEANEIPVCDIRLYCLRLDEYVVILFNGGVKTTIKAQDCPNVCRYFKEANRLAKQIDRLIQTGEIKWNSNHTDILFDNSLTIEL